MPFVRRSRDKRGYEHIYLMHAYGRRGKPSKPRVLYWFRTPPGVKVGREPFDETMRRTVEAQNPGVLFDWKKLSILPDVPPDVEHWRERRRAERAAKQARRAEEAAASATADRDADVSSEEPDQPADQNGEEPIEIAAAEGSAFVESGSDEDENGEGDIDHAPESEADDVEDLEPLPGDSTVAASASDEHGSRSEPKQLAANAPAAPGVNDQEKRRRRRRRGGRRRRRKHGAAVTNGTSAAPSIQVAEDSPGAAKNSTETSKSAEDPSKED